MKSQFSNIVLRGANWVGDAVMTLPAVAALAQALPQARLTVLARPWAAPVYEHCPQAPELMCRDKGGLGDRLRLAWELRAKKFDLALIFPNSFDSALTPFLASVPQRWGYARDGRGLLLTKAFKLRAADRLCHESFYYLNILARAGLKAPFSLPRLRVPEAAALKAEELWQRAGLSPAHFVLALAPGAAFGTAKRWPAENFARAAALILDQIGAPGRALILGGPSEKPVAEEVANLLPGRAWNMAGRTPLSLSLALLKRSQVLVTNDSGLMHLGGALGLPLVAAFGPTNPLTTAPLGRARLLRSPVDCSPCLKRHCPLARRICFDGVSAERVASAALSLLSPPPPAGRPAVFLDRDGTINEEVNFLSRPEDLRLIEGAAEAVAALKRAGLAVVVVTNQSGLARGLFSLEDLERVHRRLDKLLAAEGAKVDAYYFCPHHPQGSVPELAIDCQCRKPGPALFERAAKELGLDLARSFWVGDRLRDLKAAARFGGRSVLTLTGYGLAEAGQIRSFQPTLVASDLRRAAEWIEASVFEESLEQKVWAS